MCYTETKLQSNIKDESKAKKKDFFFSGPKIFYISNVMRKWLKAMETCCIRLLTIYWTEY